MMDSGVCVLQPSRGDGQRIWRRPAAEDWAAWAHGERRPGRRSVARPPAAYRVGEESEEISSRPVLGCNGLGQEVSWRGEAAPAARCVCERLRLVGELTERGCEYSGRVIAS
jgi:hypothetical protein